MKSEKTKKENDASYLGNIEIVHCYKCGHHANLVGMFNGAAYEFGIQCSNRDCSNEVRGIDLLDTIEAWRKLGAPDPKQVDRDLETLLEKNYDLECRLAGLRGSYTKNLDEKNDLEKRLKQSQAESSGNDRLYRCAMDKNYELSSEIENLKNENEAFRLTSLRNADKIRSLTEQLELTQNELRYVLDEIESSHTAIANYQVAMKNHEGR